MFPKLLFLAILIPSSLTDCPDIDGQTREIKGICYKFVTSLMKYEDARDWCHHHNPAGPSWLAYVPDQETSNFLAVYAGSIFGEGFKHFWIGLNRDPISKTLSWDTGLSVSYTNFGSNVAQNYFSENITNTKWNTLGDDEVHNFVCSYRPSTVPATVTRQPQARRLAAMKN
ncbi:C-type lectin domain-containing protein [Caenorhabditis elegans]|uniref:C-type lectin domain-containing protein n=1 Tax=Caenorhabditis elegans TaxID=6239 RepID=Q9XUC9_CAEEL|nr:C-type lectin domain-containing protein [Caenorhabditis elegans]CAB05254.1 C-type lectin domain-containing protein [Caenorhabditis elegans]|eukprot:NP_507836.1 C-type LECtin [Caenorhabditis elegans]